MSSEADSRIARRYAAAHRRRRRSRFYSRWWFWLIIALVLILVACASWVSVRALQAKQDLQSSTPLISTLKSQVLAQNGAGAKATYAKLEPKVTSARELTSDPLWRFAEVVPVLGRNLAAVRILANETDAVVTGAVHPLVTVSSSLSLESLKPHNGRIDVTTIEKIIPALTSASSAIDKALTAVNGVDTSGTLSQVVAAKTKLQTMLASTSTQLHSANSVLAIMPGVLGANGPRNYLLIFQNNGELMPAGGTTGSMAVMNVDKGAIKLIAQSSAAPAEFPMFDSPVISVPADASALYPTSLGRFVQNLTETPRFPLTFDIAKAMWMKAKGIQIDGMIAVDTVALSHFLAVTGPVPLIDGTQLTSANAVQTLLFGLYEKHDAATVDLINQAVAGSVMSKLLDGGIDPKALASFVATASKEHRILLWSSNKAEQAVIEKSSFYGAPPKSTATTDAFGVYFRDMTPSKMAYFLKQNVDLSQATCKAGGPTDVRITVKLTNTAAADAGATLPRYVTVADGHIRLGVTAYSPHGYKVAAIKVSNGGEAPLTGTDGEYTAAQDRVTIMPGQTQTITFDLIADHADKRALAAQVTPAVSPTTITQGTLNCATWPSK
ncbi:DUF4012 domain-containing protein [Diaminobutyricibacter tongyongensis]|uniref:DUF4012 domain-containing protein n=1 Tax=Leifsonia tongyongensis TaxID=1268043 RepID=A0A6L9XWN0_9MICO|nr:DUF4012 domain-containing protein [Diaminobutyricibacter tongyongensis]NEN05454.1 DUF4012 domain-containing protein [Diaminobutyricibacter tongyongensis]